MTMNPGTRLGPYEIIAPIGAGGMGEVYRARDTRLDRSIAVKILPAELAQNAQLRIRFEREAKTISQLNHPHICTLYDVGDGYLVMELLDGESLADRLAKGPMPIAEVLKFGIEIAEALSTAHREGIVHRDLKPGNVMLTKSGAKLLDFGLAKSSTSSTTVDSATVQKPLTQEGTILGTFQYMAPEQLAAEEPDARTDIFALGAVLYEMATGKRAFEGKSKTSLIGAIVSGEPTPISRLQPLTPPAFEHVVSRCLAKEPDERWQSASDIAQELRWIREAGSQAGVAAPVAQRRQLRSRVSWLLNVALVIAAAASTWEVIRLRREPPRVIHASILAPDKSEFAFDGNRGPMALSRDGTRIAFIARQDGKSMLWVRALGVGTAERLAGTEGAAYPFWSPDGRSIGFFADGKLKRIETSGGPPQTLCDATSIPRGASWNASGVILFTPGIRDGLSRVSAAGGTPEPVTRLNAAEGEYSHRFPMFLPDDRHFLYSVHDYSLPFTTTKIFVGSVDGKERKFLLTSDSAALYVPSGYLLFIRDRTVRAQPFDAKRLQLSGEPQPVAEDVAYYESNGAAMFTASYDGTLAYQSSAGGTVSQLVFVDRNGKETARLGEPGVIGDPRLSHYGDRIVYSAGQRSIGGASDLWILDIARGVPTRFTFNRLEAGPRLWSPDEKSIAYTSSDTAYRDVLLKGSDGVSNAQTIYRDAGTKDLTDWSSDGRYLMFQSNDPKTRTNWDLWVLDVSRRTAAPFLQTQFAEMQGTFSPDVKWVAYVSDETGNTEVYVQPFPAGQGKWQISVGGGLLPQWSRDGKQLFYQGTDGKLYVVAIDAQPSFHVSVPEAIMPIHARDGSHPAAREWSATADSGRFLINEPLQEEAPVPITIVTNWAERLKK